MKDPHKCAGDYGTQHQVAATVGQRVELMHFCESKYCSIANSSNRVPFSVAERTCNKKAITFGTLTMDQITDVKRSCQVDSL